MVNLDKEVQDSLQRCRMLVPVLSGSLRNEMDEKTDIVAVVVDAGGDDIGPDREDEAWDWL